LYQEANLGIDYEYSLPKETSVAEVSDSYHWVSGEFSECSEECGGGDETSCATSKKKKKKKREREKANM
jgi:hypothetical protein